MNEDEQKQQVWERPLGFGQFVGGFNNPQATQAIINLNEQAARERYLKQQEEKQKNSEIVRVHTPEGKTSTSPQVIGMSGTDPVAQFLVEGVALGPAFKLAGKGALYGLGRYGSGAAQNWARAKVISGAMDKALGNSAIPAASLLPKNRIKIGDVEINNPELYYHQSGLGKAKNFFNTNRMRTPQEEYWLKQEHVPLELRTGIIPGFPQNPGRAMFSQGKLWYGLNPEQFPDLLVTAKEMPVANSKAGIIRGSLQKLESQGTRRVTSDNIGDIGPHTNQNTSAYTYVPEYGYRQIQQEPRTSLRFFTKNPKLAKTLTNEQWDAGYLPAVKNKDLVEAQTLRDLHFGTKSGNDNMVFAHTTPNSFTVFDKSYFGRTDAGFNGKGFYFSTTRIPEGPLNYKGIRGPRGEIPTMNYGKNKIYVYLKGNREFDIGNPERNFFNEPDVVGVAGKTFDGKPHEVIIGNPNNIKLTDAITYDNQKNIIPLSMRDNFMNPDMRYQNGGKIIEKFKNRNK